MGRRISYAIIAVLMYLGMALVLFSTSMSQIVYQGNESRQSFWTAWMLVGVLAWLIFGMLKVALDHDLFRPISASDFQNDPLAAVLSMPLSGPVVHTNWDLFDFDEEDTRPRRPRRRSASPHRYSR